MSEVRKESSQYKLNIYSDKKALQSINGTDPVLVVLPHGWLLLHSRKNVLRSVKSFKNHYSCSLLVKCRQQALSGPLSDVELMPVIFVRQHESSLNNVIFPTELA